LALEDVEKKVLASAKQEAEEIVQKATAQAEEDLERRRAALRDEQERKISAAKAEADADYEREVNTRRAEHNMKVLGVKNEIIDAIFARAKEKILASEGFDYGAWLAEQVRQATEAGSGTLHCNQRDRTAVSAALDQAQAQGVTLADDPASFDGGVLLVSESFDLDLTLDSALADLRQEMTVSLGERLFADVPTLSLAAADEE
jgi:V/A-type H+-transporting ATPase subunit E